MNDKEVDAVREEGYLNDLYYEDRPMKLIVPEPLAKINEEELELSRKKNREMIAAIRRKQPLSIQTEDSEIRE